MGIGAGMYELDLSVLCVEMPEQAMFVSEVTAAVETAERLYREVVRVDVVIEMVEGR